MDNPTGSPVSAGKAAPLLLRLFGAVVALAYLVLGSVVVFMFLIGGLWAGFADRSVVLQFLGIVLYVYGTAALGVWIALRPAKGRAVMLAVLVVPGLVSIALVPDSGRGQAREAAEIFVANESAQQAEQARAVLLEHGRRAGRQPHVEILIDAPDEVDSDAERVRLVCVLGELSYLHEPLLEMLRGLAQTTGGDPERAELHEVARYALIGVNPYEGMAPAQGAARRPPLPAACDGQASPTMAR